MIVPVWRNKVSTSETKFLNYTVGEYCYAHGRPIGKKLIENLDDLKERVVVNGKAGLIIIDGNSGEGKTTLGVHIADHLNGGIVSFEEYLGMGGLDFAKKLKYAYTEKGVFSPIYDEAGDFDRRGAITGFNRFINRIFDTYRTFKKLPILILPRFWILDQPIFDKGIPRLLIHCYGRGLHQGEFKAYAPREMHYLLHWSKKLVVKSDCYNFVKSNFDGHFLNLNPGRCSELDRYCSKGKLNLMEAGEIQLEGLLTIEDVARKVGKSVPWVRLYLKKFKVKHAKVYKNKYFYNSDIVERMVMAGEVR